MTDLLNQVTNEEGLISPRAIADLFHTTIKEVAELCELSVDALNKHDRVRSERSQKRLRELMLILSQAEPWCGGRYGAYAWYRSEPIPSFGDATAEDMLKQGKAELVMQHIRRIEDGGYS